MSNPIMDKYVTYTTLLHKNNYVKKLAEAYGRYVGKELTIKKLTGLDLDELIRLFAAGYTLEPPIYDNTSLSEMLKGEEK